MGLLIVRVGNQVGTKAPDPQSSGWCSRNPDTTPPTSPSSAFTTVIKWSVEWGDGSEISQMPSSEAAIQRVVYGTDIFWNDAVHTPYGRPVLGNNRDLAQLTHVTATGVPSMIQMDGVSSCSLKTRGVRAQAWVLDNRA